MLARQLTPSGRRFVRSRDGSYLLVNDSYLPATVRTPGCRTVAGRYESSALCAEPSTKGTNRQAPRRPTRQIPSGKTRPAPRPARTRRRGRQRQGPTPHPSRQLPPPPTTPTNTNSRNSTDGHLYTPRVCRVVRARSHIPRTVTPPISATGPAATCERITTPSALPAEIGPPMGATLRLISLRYSDLAVWGSGELVLVGVGCVPGCGGGASLPRLTAARAPPLR